MTEMDLRLPPGPYCYQTTALPGEHDGKGHVYLIDRTGKKLASIWGAPAVKMALVALFIDASPDASGEPPPIDMILPCPKCGRLHIDAPDQRSADWKNPPHRSHLCHHCGHVWRPADVPTNGAASIKTKGKNDSPIEPGVDATAIWNEAIETAASHLDDRAQEFDRMRDPGMANHCRSLAGSLRSKKRTPPGRSGGEK